MITKNQQINTRETNRQIIYSSIISFLSLCSFFIGGYVIYCLYEQNATDQKKYIAIIFTIAALALCGFAIRRSLAHRNLTFWHLRSVRIALVTGVLESLVGVIYAYALYFLPPITSGSHGEPHLSIVNWPLLQPPIIFAIVTCVLALYIYLFFANIVQTRLFFLSVTLTVIEIIISISVFIILVLWILSKNMNVRRPLGNTTSGLSPSVTDTSQYRRFVGDE